MSEIVEDWGPAEHTLKWRVQIAGAPILGVRRVIVRSTGLIVVTSFRPESVYITSAWLTGNEEPAVRVTLWGKLARGKTGWADSTEPVLPDDLIGGIPGWLEDIISRATPRDLL